jgi:hypothetical protein
MTDHRCGLPPPEAKKTKSSSRFAVSNVMESVGPPDAVGPHANKSMQMGSRQGKYRVFTVLRRRQALPTRSVVRHLQAPWRQRNQEPIAYFEFVPKIDGD